MQYFHQALPMTARFTEEMVLFFQQGARLSPPRVLPPSGPSRKIVVNLIFHEVIEKGKAPIVGSDPFRKAPRFYDMIYQRKKPKSGGPAPKVRTVSFTPHRPVQQGLMLGLDINRISTKDIVKFATPSAAVSSDAECVQVHLLRTKLSRMRNNPKYRTAGKQRPKSQFGRLSKAIADEAAKPKPDRAKLGRLKMERTLLYRRQNHLKQALDREVSLAGARVVLTQGAAGLAVEALHLDPRGTAGRLGATITDIPKRAAITKAMETKANQYRQQWHEPPVELLPILPFGTSQLCPVCGMNLKGTKDYDRVHCPQCGVDWNRHESAARIIAQRGLQQWQKRAAQGLIP